jgi:hypothetical protein
VRDGSAPQQQLMARSLALKAAQPDVIQLYAHIRQKPCAWALDQTAASQDGTSAAVRSWLRRPFGPPRRFR